MEKKGKIVLSASRRTDIPAFYMDWFEAGIRRGFFEVQNPFNQQVQTIPAAAGDVHSIVFWSKNYGPFLSRGFGEHLEKLGYHLFFHFTVNSRSSLLEPRVAPLSQRLSQMGALAQRFSAPAITWRFDPVCHYTQQGVAKNNLDDFESIADAAAACGISRCVTSFVDLYRKVAQRSQRVPGFAFDPLSPEKQAEILCRMEAVLAPRNITLFTCCEKQTLALVPASSEIFPSACIDHGLLEKLFGPGLSRARDLGQRASAGCGCMQSKDVGSYAAHPCFHDCLFCYARPLGKGL